MPLLHPSPFPPPPPPPPQDHAVEIVAQHMCTDHANSFNHSFLGLCGYFMSKEAARHCMQEAGLSANDVDVIELQDSFAPHEVHVLYLYMSVSLSVNHMQVCKSQSATFQLLALLCGQG